jgi:Ca2+-binding EF-hand superfamily protein
MKTSKLVLIGAAAFATLIGINAHAASPADGKHFAMMDKNADGFISREEAAAFPRLNKHFDRIDTNRDGKLSKEEISIAHEAQQARRLKAIDVNNDGLISREETSAHPKLSKHFDRIDTNKDGFLSKDELAAAKAARHGEKKPVL